MHRRGSPRLAVLYLFAAALVLGCANSEGIDIDAISTHRPATSGSGGSIDPTGLAGSGGPGNAGASGSGDTTKTMGTPGAGGSTGTTMTGTQGQAGDGSAGSSGQGQGGASGTGTGGNSSGQAGSSGGGSGGSGFGGSTGRGGAAGSATGFGGRGGTAGSAVTGRGGTGGTTGRGGTGGSASPDAGTTTDGGTETFTDVYNTILVTYCAGSRCHNPGSSGGVGFSSKTTAYNALKSRVIAGNSAGSSFYQVVQSGAMPQGAAKLSAANLAKIAAWIDAGALNN